MGVLTNHVMAYPPILINHPLSPLNKGTASYDLMSVGVKANKSDAVTFSLNAIPQLT